MPEADGQVRIKVNLDSGEVDKDMKKLESKLASQTESLERQGIIVEKLATRYDELRIKAEKIKTPGLESDKITNAMESLGKELDLAIKKEKRLTDEVNSTKNAIQDLQNQRISGFQDNFSSFSKGLENMKNDVRSHLDKAGEVFENIGRKVEGIGTRILKLASSAFVFNIISAGFREMSQGIQNVIASDNQLSGSLSQVQANLWTAFYPIYQAVLPALRALGQALSWITGQLVAFIAMLTGTSVQVNQAGGKALAAQTQNIGKASKALGKQAKGYDKVGKAAKKARGELASFDKIEVLRQNHDNGGAGANVPGGAGGGGAGSPISGIVEGFKAQTPKLLDSIAEAFERLRKPFENMDLSNLTSQLSRLWEVIKRFGGKIGDGLWWFYENVLAPLAAWTIQDVLPAFLRILNAALIAIEPVVDEVGADLIFLWDNFLKPMAEWTGGEIDYALEQIADALDRIGEWIKENRWFVESIFAILIGIAGALTVVKIRMIAWAAALWLTSGGLTAVIASTLAWTAALLANPVTWVIAGITALIAVIILCAKHWDQIKEAAVKAWDKIKETWKPVGDWFNQNVAGPIAGIWDMITGAWRTGINDRIAMFEYFLNKIIGGVNLLTGALSKIGFDIPDFTGSGHFGIKIPAVSLPRLAQGAVLEGGNPFLAMINDQPRGQTNIETPLNTMIEAFKTALGSTGGQNIIIEANGDFNQFIRFLNFKLKQEEARIGQSFVTGDAWI